MKLKRIFVETDKNQILRKLKNSTGDETQKSNCDET